MEISLESIVGILAGALSAVAYILYNISIIKGTTKPNRATWWILTLVGFIILLSYYAEGARETIWVPVAYVVGPLIIALLSIKHGDGKKWETFDKWCLAGALFGALLWAFSGSALVALLINIFIDFLGLLPTLKKAYLRPEGEDKTAWLLEALSSLLNLIAVKPWVFVIAVYPVYLVFINALVAGLLFYGKHKRGKNPV